jgi:hypothetical protein
MSDKIIRFMNKACELLARTGCPHSLSGWSPKDPDITCEVCVANFYKSGWSTDCWHEFVNEQIEEKP